MHLRNSLKLEIFTNISQVHFIVKNICDFQKYFADSPVFVKQPQDVTGDSGDRVTLECLVDSNPPGEYTWIRNNLSSTTKVSLILLTWVIYLIVA